MPNDMRTIPLGEGTITIFNIGDIFLPLATYMNVPAAELAARDDLRTLTEQTIVPIHAVLVRLPWVTVLIDAGVYDVVTEPEYAIAAYQPPPTLSHRLTDVGLNTADISHVIITHRHWDHFNGTTCEQDGRYVPLFPNANYYLGRADWERAQEAMLEPTSIESRTLKVLHDRGVLTLVDGDREVAAGVQIIAAPGETPGHQIVRVHSAGQTLYCLGDLYHHPVEFAAPEWKVSWAKQETILPSRRALTTRALAEHALLVATHIAPLGRLRATAHGVTWESVTTVD